MRNRSAYAERLAGTPVRFLVHDFDTPFEETGHDLAVASLCLQWSHNLRAAFENFAVALRQGGEFFASIPLESSLAQIRQLFYDENTQYRGITLPSLSLIEHALDGLFRNLSMETHRYTESYADLHSLPHMTTASIVTLGCRLNQADSALLAGRLRRMGIELVPYTDTGADVLIVNSCAVTATASRKSRQTLRQFRAKHPDAILILTGCAANVDRNSFDVDGIDLVLGNE